VRLQETQPGSDEYKRKNPHFRHRAATALNGHTQRLPSLEPLWSGRAMDSRASYSSYSQRIQIRDAKIRVRKVIVGEVLPKPRFDSPLE
jgi:hypothetical protein